jgi:hypothetical protein
MDRVAAEQDEPDFRVIVSDALAVLLLFDYVPRPLPDRELSEIMVPAPWGALGIVAGPGPDNTIRIGITGAGETLFLGATHHDGSASAVCCAPGAWPDVLRDCRRRARTVRDAGRGLVRSDIAGNALNGGSNG